MEASSESTFLASCGTMYRLEPTILWLYMLIWEAKGPVQVRTGVVILGVIMTIFLSTIIGLLALFQFITGGSLRTPKVMCIAPMAISLWRTVRTACKAPLIVATPSVVVRLTVGLTHWMVAGIYLIVNNLFG